jgi:uncharacterized protein YqgC (DUF456 family)
MIELGSSLSMAITVLVMVGCLSLILIPSVPVTALEWAIALIFGLLTGFERFTPTGAIVATVLMVIGATSGLWMPFIGLKGRQISCMGMIAFFVGMGIGSAVIPIPFLGTIIGGVVGVMLLEYMRGRDTDQAIESGKTALRVVIYGMIAEFIFASAIVVTVIVSLMLTA